MIKLKDLLTENINLNYLSIPTTTINNKQYALLSTINSKLKQSKLSNIHIDMGKLSKCRFKNDEIIYSLGRDSKKKTDIKIRADYKLPLQCINNNEDGSHENEKISKYSVSDLNKMLENDLRFKSDTGTLNPCPIENRIIKSQNAKLRGKAPKNNLSAKGEVWVFKKLEEILKEDKYKEFLEGSKVLPLNKIGPKQRVVVNNTSYDLDVFLEYGEKAKSKDKGFDGIAFLLDGPTHSAPNASSGVYAADEARNHIERVRIYRIKYTGKPKLNDQEKQFVKSKTAEIINSLYTAWKGYSLDHDLSRSKGDIKTTKQLTHENREKLKQGSIRELINHLYLRSSNDPEYDTSHNSENNYISKKNGNTSLSGFLKTPQGRMSFNKHPEYWKQLVDLSPEETKAWKEKHQAKNGEKLFSTDKDGNIKLFEDKESSV